MAPVLDLVPADAARRPAGPLSGPMVWSAPTLDPRRWHLDLWGIHPELDAVVAHLRRTEGAGAGHDAVEGPLDTDGTGGDPRRFEAAGLVLTEARRLMARARRILDDGPGFVLLDRLPLDEWSEAEARVVYRLLGALVSRPVAQAPAGQILHEVRNEVAAGSEGLGLGLTTTRLAFHQDGSGNRTMPGHTGLLALHLPLDGGASRYCTLASAHNALSVQEPEASARLFQPFFHDRLGFVAPGEPTVVRAPVLHFGIDGRLRGRFSLNKIITGHEKAGVDLTAADRHALESMLRVIDDQDLAASCLIERGQILLINNPEGLHHRDGFRDGEEVSERRHLVRIWLRDGGQPKFDG